VFPSVARIGQKHGKSPNWEILTFNDCRTKYGFAELNEVFVFFEQLAGFCRKDSIDIELLSFGARQVRVKLGKNNANT
jgi:hypothetical protein